MKLMQTNLIEEKVEGGNPYLHSWRCKKEKNNKKNDLRDSTEHIDSGDEQAIRLNNSIENPKVCIQQLADVRKALKFLSGSTLDNSPKGWSTD